MNAMYLKSFLASQVRELRNAESAVDQISVFIRVFSTVETSVIEKCIAKPKSHCPLKEFIFLASSMGSIKVFLHSYEKSRLFPDLDPKQTRLFLNSVGFMTNKGAMFLRNVPLVMADVLFINHKTASNVFREKLTVCEFTVCGDDEMERWARQEIAEFHQKPSYDELFDVLGCIFCGNINIDFSVIEDDLKKLIYDGKSLEIMERYLKRIISFNGKTAIPFSDWTRKQTGRGRDVIPYDKLRERAIMLLSFIRDNKGGSDGWLRSSMN